ADYAESLPVRVKELSDGAIPSGNSVFLCNVLRLARLVDRPDFDEKAATMTGLFSGQVAAAPAAFTHFLAAANMAIGPTHELVIVGESGAPDTMAMLDAFRSMYLPDMVLLFKDVHGASSDLTRLAPFIAPYTTVGGRATAYLCYDQQCELPTNDPAVLIRQLNRR
ncbi:thioredoxin domain-containing protein, partial [bacterium]|nr:thioredoxin domain-containing protein [candidate division CSSED10-310 bacterium]